MLKDINRNNRLFMLGNFLFALSYGLWMNLRPLHLGNLGATPAQIGSILGIAAVAGGILPIPAGLLTDRFGPKRLILSAWIVAAIGTIVSALATSWQMAGFGFVIFMLMIAANPATVSFVLLNTPEQNQQGQAERVMALVFASWPAAMAFAPLIGGVLADYFGIGADLWLGTLGFIVSISVFAWVEDVRPQTTKTQSPIGILLHNRPFLVRAIYFPMAVIAIYVGYALAPLYLEEVRLYSVGTIGALYSILSIGSLGFNYVIAKSLPHISFVALISAVWMSMLLIWQTNNILLVGFAFALLGAISSLWLLVQTTFGQLVNPAQRGLALGITESLTFMAIALASWLAGQLYDINTSHDLPLIIALVLIFVVLIIWFISPLGRVTTLKPPFSDEVITTH